MTSNNNHNEKMENALSCGICMEPFTVDGDRCPRTLKECGHTFCSKCCADLVKAESIQCSVCRAITAVPAGVEGLNKAFAIVDVLQAGGAAQAAQIAAAHQTAKNEAKATSAASTSSASPATTTKSATAPPPTAGPIKMSITSHAADDLVDVLVELRAPVGVKRSPVDVCCVVDVSGSMGTEASLKNESGKTETHGLSLLDVVKHSVKTIINVLGPEDRLSVVSYSSDAKVVVALQAMTPANQKSAVATMEKMQPDGMTNLWAGARVGMDTLLASQRPGRVQTVFLLTDGQPNVEPAVGHIKALERHYAANSNLRCSFHTFGFGYQVDSKLLVDMAKVGHGSYVFIPDSSFVGTGFVNGIANVLTTIGQQATLRVTPLNGAKFANSSESSMTFQLGDLTTDISKHVVVHLKVPSDVKKLGDYVEASLRYYATDGVGTQFNQDVVGSSGEGGQLLKSHVWRAELVDALERAVLTCSDKQGDPISNLKSARETIEKLAKKIETENVSRDSFGTSLVTDLRGQILEALSRKDWYTRWGVHYIQSLARSHQIELCANFKDASLQSYGGPLFAKLQADGDEQFCKLPPPAPAPPPPEVLAAIGGMGAWRQQQQSRPQVSMRQYHQSSNPCFHGESLVALADGSTKKASAVRRGDRLAVPQLPGRNASTARVNCVVATKCTDGFAELVRLPSGLLVTPYHPINVGGEWHFPCSLGAVERIACREVVSFALEHNAPALLVDNVIGAALAHGLAGEVIAHPFFGTTRVLESLRKLDGFDNGRVELQSGRCIVRDAVTGLICDLRQS